MKLKPIEVVNEPVEVKKDEKKEKKKNKKPTSFNHLWTRIGVMATVVFVGLIIFNSMQRPSDEPAILGTEKSADSTSIKEIADVVTEQAQEETSKAAGDVLGVATDLFNQTKDDISENATKMIVDVTVKTLITQIEKLPGVQKDEVKKYLCE